MTQAEEIANRIIESGLSNDLSTYPLNVRDILRQIVLGVVDGGMLYVRDLAAGEKFVALVVDKKVVLAVYC